MTRAAALQWLRVPPVRSCCNSAAAPGGCASARRRTVWSTLILQ